MDPNQAIPTTTSSTAAAANTAATKPQGAVDPAAARKAGEDFEAFFLSQVFENMFSGINADSLFGGGNGEEMFKSVLTDAMAKQVTKAGGVGLASVIQREMLKMQGLKEQ